MLIELLWLKLILDHREKSIDINLADERVKTRILYQPHLSELLYKLKIMDKVAISKILKKGLIMALNVTRMQIYSGSKNTQPEETIAL
jgi:predicted amidophosphoribosyltransferase